MTENQRIHQRIDDLVVEVGKSNTLIAEEIALCRSCRPMVMGNGRASLDKRVAILETSRVVSAKWFTVVIVAAASLATGLIVVGFDHILGMF